MPDKLPDDIVQTIATGDEKSIAERSAILSDLALANQIFNNNLQQQLALSQVQAINQISLAIVAKCVSMIADLGEPDAADLRKIHGFIDLLKQVNAGIGTDVAPKERSPSGEENTAR